jgi:hypothetical protein
VLVVSKITSKLFQSHCNRVSYSCDWHRRPDDQCRLSSIHICFPFYIFHTDLTLWTAAVTICTTSLTFTNSTFSPHSVFMCFVWIWEQTAIISLYNINWLVFITETDSVYCAVRTKYLGTIYANFSLFQRLKFYVCVLKWYTRLLYCSSKMRIKR